MKKTGIILTSIMLGFLLAGCNSAQPSDVKAPTEPVKPTQSAQPSKEAEPSEPATPTQSEEESVRTDYLYAVFSSEDMEEIPIEYSGEKKNAEELAYELSELTGLDFIITVEETEDGLIVDWDADSTLVTGYDDQEQQKEDFYFSDQHLLRWFMMDSLWCTLAANLDTEIIYYTMDGGQELVIDELYPVNAFPSDIPYMGSEFYFAHYETRGDEEANARTWGLWRMDGATDTASIEMNGFGGFIMYYASGVVEAFGYVEYVEDDCRYDCYSLEDEWIISFYLDSDTQLHIADDDEVIYLLDRKAAYQGFWEYPDGTVLEINGDRWNLYWAGDLTPFGWGPLEYDEEAAYLMNEDGSSGGGKVFFDENFDLVDSETVLTYCGGVHPGVSTDDAPTD